MRNRQTAELRGHTRDKLDRFLLTTLEGTGVGRSAFICAAVDWFQLLDEDERAQFVREARNWEKVLRGESPDSSDAYRVPVDVEPE